MCPVCDALNRLPEIDDDEADRIVSTSYFSGWCDRHWRAWLATRAEPSRGRARLLAIMKHSA